MKLSNLEKETIILFNEAEPAAEIEVYNTRLRKRLEQLCKDRPDAVQLVRKNNELSVAYTFPKSWIKINPSRVLSDEQRKRLSDMGFKSKDIQ